MKLLFVLNLIHALHYANIVHASIPARASIPLPCYLSDESRPGTPPTGKCIVCHSCFFGIAHHPIANTRTRSLRVFRRPQIRYRQDQEQVFCRRIKARQTSQQICAGTTANTSHYKWRARSAKGLAWRRGRITGCKAKSPLLGPA